MDIMVKRSALQERCFISVLRASLALQREGISGKGVLPEYALEIVERVAKEKGHKKVCARGSLIQR
jgi:hypothetical protein